MALLNLLRGLALVAIATSTALLVDYISYSPEFCSPDSGCSAVRASGFGYVVVSGHALPVPVFGIVGFSALFTVSLFERWRAYLKPICFAAGLIAVALILLQGIKIGHFCELCMVVDISAIAIAGVAAVYPRASSAGGVIESLRIWAWSTLAFGAIAAPLAWPRLKVDAPIPQSIQQFYKPGRINVVEFADFQCPFCRMLHPTLKKLVEEYGDRANFVRLNMPLASHEHAMDAAKGAVCASEQGKKEPMAERLFDSEDLSPTGIRRIAVDLGLDPATFDHCVKNPKTLERIQRESKILRDAGFQGLPTTYVGGRLLVGALPEETFREAFEQAARGGGAGGVPGWLYLGLLAVGAGAIVYLGRARSPRPEAKPEPAAKPAAAPDDG